MTKRNSVTPLSARQIDLGNVEAHYSVLYPQLVQRASALLGREKGEKLVQDTFAQMMHYLKSHPQVSGQGSRAKYHKMVMRGVGDSIQLQLMARSGALRSNPAERVKEELPRHNFGITKSLVLPALKKGVSVLVRGSPGIGKSDMAKEIANEIFGPGFAQTDRFVDIRLAQTDPVELAGILFPKQDSNTIEAFLPDWAVRAHKEPCFIFLDEINAAVSKMQQSAAYKIVLDRQVGPLKLHPKTVIMAAGNLKEDGALVEELSSALANRFVHFVMKPTAKEWLVWADKNLTSLAGVAIREYIRNSTDSDKKLYNNSGKYVAFPTPRSWSTLARLLDQPGLTDAQARMYAEGTIGPEEATDFINFYSLRQKFDIERILDGAIPNFDEQNKAGGLVYNAPVMAGLIRMVGDRLATAGQPSGSERLTDAQVNNVVRLLKALQQRVNSESGGAFELAKNMLREVWQKNEDVSRRIKMNPNFRDFAASAMNQLRSAYTNPRLRRNRR